MATVEKKTLRKVAQELRQMANVIKEFDRECEEREGTDTEVVWEILHSQQKQMAELADRLEGIRNSAPVKKQKPLKPIKLTPVTTW